MDQSNFYKLCSACQLQFSIALEDRDFYQELSVPEPKLCPNCRQQRRLAWRNERNLYKRKCSGTGREIVSVFSEDKLFPVFENEYWYSDKWNPLVYGREFDFNRPFFEQIKDLMNRVPQLARSAVDNYNSEYVNQCGWCKNCYLIFEADGNEDCLYSTYLYNSRTCMDLLQAEKCELCFQCIDCSLCYNLRFSQDCVNCSDSAFLKGCIGVSNCFGCVNLRNKQYYYLNQPYSKEDYEQKMRSIDLYSYKELMRHKDHFDQFVKQFPHKYLHGSQNDNSVGDYLWNTQNCLYCFNLSSSQDCRFVYNARKMKKVYDVTVFGAENGAEFCYECHEIGDGVRNIYFSDQIWSGCCNIFYSKLCLNNSHDLFGCVGLKHAEYCILNKQYPKEEYEKLIPKIIEHMKKTGEWGEFFPIKFSPFAYNETEANFWFPLTKDNAISQGFAWKEEDKRDYRAQTYSIPDYIGEVSDAITGEILACECSVCDSHAQRACKKNFKIIPQELKLYRQWNVPVPRRCFECRHKARIAKRNPRKLWERSCGKCGVSLKTTYAPESPEIMYCEKCYLESVY